MQLSTASGNITAPKATDSKHGKSDNARYFDALFSMLKSKIITHKPFFLAHAITYGCNSRCKTCTYWKMTPRMKEDMSTNEVFELLDEAYDFGMRGYYLFGGEPLIRRDIGEVVDYAKGKGFLTTLNTNGSLLAEKAESLRNLDFIFVSLDYFNAYHDYIRGRPNSFAEVIKGVRKITEVGKAKVTLVTTISTINYDSIEPMAKLAKELGTGISYNSVEPTVKSSFEQGRTPSPVQDYGLPTSLLKAFYQQLLKLKEQGYPLMETKDVVKDFAAGKRWECRFPRMFVYVSADKKIFSCMYDHTFDLRKGTFEDYFSSTLYSSHASRAENCNECIRTCVRGYSYAYDFKPRNLISLASDAGILFKQEKVYPVT